MDNYTCNVGVHALQSKQRHLPLIQRAATQVGAADPLRSIVSSTTTAFGGLRGNLSSTDIAAFTTLSTGSHVACRFEGVRARITTILSRDCAVARQGIDNCWGRAVCVVALGEGVAVLRTLCGVQ